MASEIKKVTIEEHTVQKIPQEVIINGPRDKKQVALTFDADMTPEMKKDLLSGFTQSSYNKKVIDILEQTKTKATIFMTGMWIELYPDVTAELANNPLFELGNHSYSHPGFDGECWGLTPSPDERNHQEIQQTQDLLKKYAHLDNKLFRFPGGCYSSKDLEDVVKEGLYVVHWDSVADDGFNDDVSNIENNVLSTAQNGSIIVMHINGPPNAPLTAEALPTIISTLKERGFEFVKLSEMLGIKKELRKISVSDFLNNIGYN
jgi:peptidoglycan/xylan/chitin deacetylase (PgdA/CDA1 family)